MRKVFFLCLFLSVIACQKEEPPSPPNIDSGLTQFVNLFYTEAESRGIDLPRNIDALIVTDIDACGQGHSPDFNGMFDRPTVLINETCWSGLDEVARENLVFHELGHALLNRIHIDGILPNGYRKSMMCAGADFSCSSLPSYSSCPEYRTYYVDELFDVATAPPQWATRSWSEVSTILSDLNVSNRDDWQIFTNCSASSFQVTIDSVSQNRPSNYSLRIASQCGDFITVRRRLKIEDASSADAIRLRCNLYQDLSGDGFRASLFVKNTSNVFTSFNRSAPEAIIQQDQVIDDFILQAECLEANADSLILDFQYLATTVGEVFIGDLDILLME